MKNSLLLFLLLFTTLTVHAQKTSQIAKDSIVVDSTKVVSALIRQSLSTVATGVSEAGNFATYGSFEPVNGAYKFNIYGSAGKRNFLFYNISATGKIVGDNTGVLFNNSKFNSNTSLSGKIHIPLKGGTFEAGKDSRLEEVSEKIRGLKRQALAQQKAVKQQYENVRVDSVLRLKYLNEWEKAKKDLKLLNDSITGASTELKKEKFEGSRAKELATLLSKLNPKLDEKIKNESDLSYKYLQADSFTRDAAYKSVQIGKAKFLIAQEFNEKIEALYTTLKATGMDAMWVSIVGNYSKTKYNTFNGALPFSEQIKELNYNVFNFGVELNRYIKNSSTSKHFKNKTFFFNLGFIYKRANDIDDYSTWEVTKSAKYTLSDSTNTLGKKYTVYTDKITEYKALRIYGSIYYFISKTGNAAIHFFPDVEFRNNHNNPLNLGVGLIFAVKKKDSSVLNVELYSKFNDVGRALPTSVGNSFIKRNEIGLNFSVPVNLLL